LKEEKKKPKLIWLTLKTRDSDHEIMIT
jgi:hypothetical protein